MRNMRRREVGLICLSWIWRGVGGLGGAPIFLLQRLKIINVKSAIYSNLHLQYDSKGTKTSLMVPKFKNMVPRYPTLTFKHIPKQGKRCQGLFNPRYPVATPE